MMLRIGMGLSPKSLRGPQGQPAQVMTLVVAADNVAQPATALAITIEVESPSSHAGSHELSLVDLARGPVCLVPPGIRDADGALSAGPGLWVHDEARGAATVTRQWMIDGAVASGATGLTFAPASGPLPRNIGLAETVKQGNIETTVMSAVFVLPAAAPAPAPVPAELAVGGDARMALVVEGSGPAVIQVVEPAVYAGEYTIDPAMLSSGPLWLVPARIEGTAQAGSSLTVSYRGLAVGDAAAGPIVVAGQWHRNGAPVADATGASYLVQAGDAGSTITFLETATDSLGTREQASNDIAIGGTL